MINYLSQCVKLRWYLFSNFLVYQFFFKLQSKPIYFYLLQHNLLSQVHVLHYFQNNLEQENTGSSNLITFSSQDFWNSKHILFGFSLFLNIIFHHFPILIFDDIRPSYTIFLLVSLFALICTCCTVVLLHKLFEQNIGSDSLYVQTLIVECRKIAVVRNSGNIYKWK